MSKQDIERIARVLADPTLDAPKEYWEERARAVLREIREPTPHMMDVVCMHSWQNPAVWRKMWTMMVDAMLTETGE